MKLCRSTVAALALLTLLLSASPAAFAVNTSSYVVPENAYSALHWRLVGPFRAGWGTCATGVPGRPTTFYFGAADGGVWKTTDAGNTWEPLFDHEAAASIGALAVAPSAPDTLYAGTGQVAPRWDIANGNGVYRSRDGGRSWEQVGLTDSQHIGRIWVDPRSPDVVLVAALGHLFGPNEERGVFRTTDGGRTWKKVLYRDADTGAVDLAADPAVPDVVYAALWQARRYPWQAYFTPIAGPGSGIWKSADGGVTWALAGREGLPAGPLGRIGLAVAPGTGGRRVYALVTAEEGAGLYRSDDAGSTWTRVNGDASLASWYFSRVTADPRDPDTVWVMGRSIRRSTDGGKTFTFTKGAPGGDDYHFLWIDPQDPDRRIVGADQGTVVTLNGGKTWSSWYNQPTGQFYHVATDDRFPYWIYSGQQDSGTVAVASRSDYGRISFRDWHPVGGDERDYDIPQPGNADIVYGSGLGGRLSRWSATTGQVANVSPWPVSSYGARPTTVKYRYTWITPLAISPLPPHPIYQGAQVLFRSTDQGKSWDVVSPDLTGAVPGTENCSGDVPVERARACGYGVIMTIAPSPVEAGVVWVGTDDGLVQLTRDGGETWQDVTPPELAPWSRVSQIDASPTDPATAYAAIDRHRLDDLRPYVFRTHDYGHTWTAVARGLPNGAWVSVVRQDPVKPNLLYAGTSRGAWVSFDDGTLWQPLELNLPTTGVNDLTVHGNDLVAATEGRAIWVLDDLSPLRQMEAGVPGPRPVLFPPAPAYRMRPNQNRDTPLPVEEPTATNPPTGAVLDYFLPAAPPGPIALEIADAQGEVVRRFTSGEPPARPPAEQYFTDDWLEPPAALPAHEGHNRFVWNLRWPRPPAIEYGYSIAAAPGVDTPVVPQGGFVLPGTYEVRLTISGRTLRQPLEVKLDPRVEVSTADLQAQLELERQVGQALAEVTEAHTELTGVAKNLANLRRQLAGEHGSRGLRKAADSLAADLAAFQGGGDDDLAAIGGVLASLETDVEDSDSAPTVPQHQVYESYRQRLATARAHWQALRDGAVKKLDARSRKEGFGPLLP